MHVLGDDPGASSQVGQRDLVELDTAEANRPLGWFDQAEKQPGQCGLTAAGAAEHADRCSRWHRECDVVDDS